MNGNSVSSEASSVTAEQFVATWDQTKVAEPQNESDPCLLINANAADVSANDSAILGEVQEEPEIDIIINNVVCTFNTRCHLNLKTIAMTGMNVIYRRENGMVSMKIRKPSVTASIWSSGKITCTGSTSEEEARIAGRKVARCLWRLGFKTRFTHFRVVNVLGTCSFPFAIRISEFSRDHPRTASYEPELHPGVTYRIPEPKATIKIFSTGSITVTAPSVMNVQSAIEHIYPLVYEYKLDKAVKPVVRSEYHDGDHLHHREQSYSEASVSKKRSKYQTRGAKYKRPRHLEEDSDGENWTESEEEYSCSEESD